MSKALVQQGQRWYWVDIKRRFKFVGRSGGVYYWQSTKKVDSRVEEIYCNVIWFWGTAPPYAQIGGPVHYPRKPNGKD